MLKKKWRIVKDESYNYFIQYTRFGIIWNYIGKWEDDGHESSYFCATKFASLLCAETYIANMVYRGNKLTLTNDGYEVVKTLGRL